MPAKVGSSGPIDARVMVIAEAPGGREEELGEPFVGNSGDELDKMLCEAGFLPDPGPLPYHDRAQALRKSRYALIRLSNVCKYRPPENKIEAFYLDKKFKKPNDIILEGQRELLLEVETVKPKLIICLGNLSLWAFRGERGITKWRGSMLEYKGSLLMPTYHPANILRDWSNRVIAVHDLKRAKQGLSRGHWNKPNYSFLVRPSYVDVMTVLNGLHADAEKAKEPIRIASDIETRSTYIACHGIAWNSTDAICIPSMCVERPTGYWTLEQDLNIWAATRRVLTHSMIEVIGQNYLYDAQYFARRWGYIPNCVHDTLFQQAVAFPGSSKGLDFLSSMYRQHHVYWKDEGKHWDSSMPEDRLWSYNCMDAVATFEVNQTLDSVLTQCKLTEQYRFHMVLWKSMLRIMLRGVLIDKKIRSEYAIKLIENMTSHQQDLDYILGYSLNVGSPLQVMNLFYTRLKLPVVLHKKTKKPTSEYDALEKCVEREPLLRKLADLINDMRSMRVFFSNFISAPLSDDGRMRSSYGLAETLRLTSSEDAFGTGTNLQNIPKGDEDDAEAEEKLLPNVRKMFIPDPGYTFCEIDLAGADAQVVAWTSGDEKLKAAFRAGLKVHVVNSRDLFGEKSGPSGKAEPYYTRTKVGVHLTNYVGSARTCAASLHIPEYEARAFQSKWFALHPAIPAWHERVTTQLQDTRQIPNRFGYRRYYFDRISEILPEAVAWEPQSTVAILSEKAWVAIDQCDDLRRLGLEVLMQVHDSLNIHYPTRNEAQILPLLRKIVTISVPFDDPLTIQWGLKTSTVSWGDCAERAWPEA